jgi:hypothetical protein
LGDLQVINRANNKIVEYNPFPKTIQADVLPNALPSERSSI